MIDSSLSCPSDTRTAETVFPKRRIQLLATLKFLRSSISWDDFIFAWLQLLCSSFPSSRSSCFPRLAELKAATGSVWALLTKPDLSTFPLNSEPGPARCEPRAGMHLGKVPAAHVQHSGLWGEQEPHCRQAAGEDPQQNCSLCLQKGENCCRVNPRGLICSSPVLLPFEWSSGFKTGAKKSKICLGAFVSTRWANRNDSSHFWPIWDLQCFLVSNSFFSKWPRKAS